ncbi:hypothetical protein NQ318_002873 [Aromia moschata]|uniref:Uncharacterized protein n=1 Tax=Aromia moschata TaxID=1265417 RepID=A0AAV8Y827_9CUCU|nr:hypothetical protein NQ318_002873 [Aromia moschata]
MANRFAILTVRLQLSSVVTRDMQLGIAIRKTGSGNPADPASEDIYRIRHQFAGSGQRIR